MEFNYAYKGHSNVDNRADHTALSFAPDGKRKPTFFQGELQQGLAFREAMSALHDVVVSDLRFKPKDKSAYKAWAEQREQEEFGELLEQIGGQRRQTAARMKILREELEGLRQRQHQRMGRFYQARQHYFDYLYKKDRDAWFVLDPVISVHPDELFFECFSQDESSYGRLSVDYSVFKNVGEFACGTTNIDYSAALYDEFQKIRNYKSTRFEIDPSGFEVQTDEDESYREVKIDLPDSWVRGFLQVNSAMTLPAVRCELHPLDVHNLCFILRRHKERQGPRSLRYCLTPGEPIKLIFEPWNHVLVCRRSIYQGPGATEIRVWGRRRLHILERLIPIARRFTVHLLGSGMPSFYVADLGELWFTLGLSGWTANDWASAANFDLLAPRTQVDQFTRRRVFKALQQSWFESPEALAKQLDMERAGVLGALGIYTQAGRAIFDLNKQVYRLRELSREPLSMEQLRFSNPREESAHLFLEQGAVRIKQRYHDAAQALHLSGSVRDRNKTFMPVLLVDADERIIEAQCGCNWHQQNKLYKGPCEHILALRLYHRRH